MVEKFNDGDKSIIGSSYCRQRHIVCRLSLAVLRRRPGLDHRIGRRLARVRRYIQICELRQQPTKKRTDRRVQRQVPQHANSQR